jgi:curved DNA-binding protein CbpA
VTAGADPYKTLQVDPEAEDEVIAAAYRRLARKYHPDVAPGPEAAARMTAINAAWELIGEPGRRAEFDRRRASEAASPGGAAQSGATAPTRPGAGSAGPRPPETVSRDWTSGRSTFGGGYDATMHRADGAGAAGPPPGNASGSVLNFGRYAGWSLGEIGRRDIEYLEWLDRMPIGRPYRDEIDALLRAAGLRRSADPAASERRGLFRRR